MNIRIATEEDASALVDFNQAMALETEGKELDRETLSLGVSAVFADKTKGFYVVAEEDGTIIGGLMVTYEWSDWRNGWFWWIQSVFIVPAARGRGIYSDLYDFVKSRADEVGGICGFRLYVERENEHAQAVYEKVGMTASNYLMFEEEA
ncbi:MAG: GNAT family N-acetyltransferase [Blastocatellia bacterium]|nr:GNAT family N-acetyltransferase [Chloracidobacterium sp.]MBL8185681.1 GNAT family N-acetyltransferase [Blastocatellia bacterium]HRJ88026.1 GNAT family N-acetyltransferase [Pyrinomonadaceae bacterium]HRK51226.1 GNAT family N-acetyltransferase [Pyrinomonadaceae bacterium]